MKYCINCQKEATENSKFCPLCGMELQEMNNVPVQNENTNKCYCNNCGAEMEGDFCSQCGAKSTFDSPVAGEKKNKKKNSKQKDRKKWNWKYTLTAVVCVVVVVIGGIVGYQLISRPDQDYTKWVTYAENGMVGYKDKDGKLVMEAQYYGAHNFATNGMASVAMG